MTVRALAVLAALLSATPTHSHSFYDSACCHDRDCYPIDTALVRATPDGWVVTLNPGDHPLVRATTQTLFRYTDEDPNNNGGTPREARRSPDGRFHACVVGTRVICLYAPDMDT